MGLRPRGLRIAATVTTPVSLVTDFMAPPFDSVQLAKAGLVPSMLIRARPRVHRSLLRPRIKSDEMRALSKSSSYSCLVRKLGAPSLEATKPRWRGAFQQA